MAVCYHNMRLDKEALEYFLIEVMPAIIPCNTCSEHYEQNIKDMPPDFTNLIKWVFDFHNYINSKVDKPRFSEEEFAAKLK